LDDRVLHTNTGFDMPFHNIKSKSMLVVV